MNCLVTLNVGDYLCANARASLSAAARRWGCDFVEMTEHLVGSRHILFNKIAGIQRYCTGYQQVMLIDADALIREDAPSPFERFSGERLYAVRDMLDGWDAPRLAYFRADVTDPWLRVAHDWVKAQVDIKEMLATATTWFFNSGSYVFRPALFATEMDLFMRSVPESASHQKMEQALWNYIVRGRVELVDRTWNCIEPDLSSGKMNCFVYHFTGITWSYLRSHLPHYDWKL